MLLSVPGISSYKLELLILNCIVFWNTRKFSMSLMDIIIYFIFKAILPINRNTEITHKVFFLKKHTKTLASMLLNTLQYDLNTLSLIVRTLLLVTLQLIIILYESAKTRVLHTFEKNAHITKFLHFLEILKSRRKGFYKSTSKKLLLIIKRSLLYSNSVPLNQLTDTSLCYVD